MERKQKVFSKKIIAVTVLMTLLAVVFIIPSSVSAKQEPYEITIATLPAGFGSYIIGVAMAELINKNSDWLKATATEGRGPAENMKTAILDPNRRKNYMFLNSTWDLWEAKRGLGTYAKIKFDFDEFGFLSLIVVAGNGLCTTDPKIKTLKNLEGKKVIFDSKRGKSREIAYIPILKKMGVNVDSLKFQYAPGKAASDNLKDGLVDAIYSGHLLVKEPDTFSNSPFTAQLTATKDVYYLSFDEKAVMDYKKETGHPMLLAEVPPKMMGPKQLEPCNVLMKTMAFCAHRSMPDHVVNEVVRIASENADKFKEYTKLASLISKDTIAKLGIEEGAYHKAAVAYYKANGIEIGGF